LTAAVRESGFDEAKIRTASTGPDQDGSLCSPWRCGPLAPPPSVASSRLLEMLPKKTLRHFQSIANWGACRKTPVGAENHHLDAKKVAGLMAIAAARPTHLNNPLFAALSRTNPSRRQTLLPATTTRDLISISEMMT
jgi:hypothetical protein